MILKQFLRRHNVKAQHNIPHSGELYDEASRKRKALKLRTMLFDSLRTNTGRYRAVDVGCSTGLIASVLAKDFASFFGLDISVVSIRGASRNNRAENVQFFVGDGLNVPLPSGEFDVLICAQCYEHVANSKRLSEEVFRLLRPGGICLFSGPNRLAIVEDHYGLPLLSWLPRSLANIYVRIAGRGDAYEERPLTLWGLRNLWRNFLISDYTVKMICEPRKFSIDDELGALTWLRHLPQGLLQFLLIFAPNYNWVLVKQK